MNSRSKHVLSQIQAEINQTKETLRELELQQKISECKKKLMQLSRGIQEKKYNDDDLVSESEEHEQTLLCAFYKKGHCKFPTDHRDKNGILRVHMCPNVCYYTRCTGTFNGQPCTFNHNNVHDNFKSNALCANVRRHGFCVHDESDPNYRLGYCAYNHNNGKPHVLAFKIPCKRGNDCMFKDSVEHPCFYKHDVQTQDDHEGHEVQGWASEVEE